MLGAPMPIQSVGFPQGYPYATSQPLPSAILRPLQQPLYDTEVMPSTSTPSELIFFQRQLGQTTAYGSVTKSIAETNLTQPGQLANPLEFSLFGFLFEVEPGIANADFITIYKTCAFTFTYTGNRVYLQIPLTRIPQGLAPEGFIGVSGATATTISAVHVHQGVGHISNLYKFTIGRSALRIRPTESFQAKLAWPNGAPTITAATRLRVFLVGISWTAL